jgi:serine/threonine-protein kinase
MSDRAEEAGEEDVRIIGRYALHGELASGGMAAVHLGRLLGPVGFARTVAIKRLHSQYARDPEFVAMFLDEARLVARIRHPNVVPTLDVVTLDGEIFLVMEYVHGEPVSRIMMALARRRERMPVNIAVGICLGLLEGLHAAHEAKSEDGTPLGIVHRDVSPQNVLIGADGVTRVLDFGIAKAVERIQTTEDGSFKGKLGYMPPDVLSGSPVDRRADLWGAGVVFWEMLVGKRLFQNNESPHALIRTVVEGNIDLPSKRGVEVSPAIEAVLQRALMKSAADRFQTAREMASALEDAAAPASNRVVGEWLAGLLREDLEKRAAAVARMELSSRAAPPSVGTVRTLAFSRASLTPGSNPPEAMTAAPVVYQPEAPRRRAVVAMALVFSAVLVAVSVVGGRAMWKRRHATAERAGAAPSASELPLEPRVAVASTPTASVSTTTSAAPSAPSASAPAVSSVRPSPRPPIVQGGASRSCSPPYTIGPAPDYIRKPKLECLPR